MSLYLTFIHLIVYIDTAGFAPKGEEKGLRIRLGPAGKVPNAGSPAGLEKRFDYGSAGLDSP